MVIQKILSDKQDTGHQETQMNKKWFVTGAPDERWDNDMLHLLDVLIGNDFEAVDTSVLMVDPDSGEVH